MTCKNPVGFDTLLAWWLAELPGAEEAAVEEHLFSCAHCTRRGEELAALAAGIRAALRGGAVKAVISEAFLALMRKEGLRLREYRVAPGGSVNCTIRAEDDGVVSRLAAPLAGVKRLDALHTVQAAGLPALESRLEDVPFDPAAGEVLFLPQAAAVRKLPANTLRVRLVSVEEGGERELGTYTLVHTPS